MVRNIHGSDAGAIADICRYTLGYSTEPTLVKQNIERVIEDPHYYVTVFEDHDGVPKGFLHAERYDLLYRASGWNIIAFAVLPDSQHRGIGTQLLASLENHARQDKAAFIRLNTRMEREKAHEFYQKSGYQCDKTQKRFIKYL